MSRILDSYGRPVTRRANNAPGGYLGAGFSRSRSHIPGYVSDARTELAGYTRYELVRKARFMAKNVGLVRGVRKSLIDHVVGPGIYPLPATADEQWNAAAWSWFWEHAKVGDVSARMNLWETQRMRCSEKFTDGEVFTLHVRSKNGWPQYQLVRSHCCGNYGDDVGPEWVDGIKVDAANRAISYRFRKRDSDTPVIVPAQSVVHGYLLETPDAVRGVTPMAHAINNLNDILDILSLEMDAVKDNSKVSRVIKTESGEDEGGEGGLFDVVPGAATQADIGIRLEQVFASEIVRLKKGESLESYASQRPSPTFMGFMDWLGKSVTNGTGFPYEFAWNPNDLKGPGVRLVLEKVRLACQEWRLNEIEDTYPFYTFSIACAMELGELPYNPEWFKVEWIGGAEDVTIDKGRDSIQDRENIKTALDSFKRYYARRGLWWKTELEQKAKEAGYIEQLAKQYGVCTDRIHLLLVNGSKPGDETQKQDPESDPEDQQPEAA
jgi:hypothetical protein